MTTPTPPGPDEPVLDSFVAEDPPATPADEAPVLDSFAAEAPAEPADAAAGASTPVVDLPVLDAQQEGVVAPDPAPVAEPAPAEPEQAEPPAAPVEQAAPQLDPSPAAAPPRGSEGLTTAPPRSTSAGPPPAESPPAAPATAGEPSAPAPPVAPGSPLPAAEDAASDAAPGAGSDSASASDAAPASASGDAPAAPAAAPAGRGRGWLPLTAVGLAVALLAGGTGWLAWELRQQDRADQASVDAVAAARDAARLLFSYDHKTLQADFDKGLAVTTGDFRAQYQRTTKDVVSPVATQYKAVVKAEVVETAVIDAQADEVTALVFLNQATTSTRVQGQQVDQSRVRMRLVPRDGRWLVEEVKAL